MSRAQRLAPVSEEVDDIWWKVAAPSIRSVIALRGAAGEAVGVLGVALDENVHRVRVEVDQGLDEHRAQRRSPLALADRGAGLMRRRSWITRRSSRYHGGSVDVTP